MIENILSPISYEIWKMLDSPENWTWNRYSLSSDGIPYTIVHPETQVALWVCNGRWFLNGYPDRVFSHDEKGLAKEFLFKTKVPQIGLFDRHILWHKVKKVLSEPTLVNELREYNNKREM